MNRRKLFLIFSMGILAFFGGMAARATAFPAGNSDTVLTAKDIEGKLFPEKIFYRGQLATTQLRNTGGVRFAGDVYLVAGLCDNGGYAANVKEKFQGYLLSEVPIEIGGETLKAGAYGFGVVGGQFVVTDLGANDVLKTLATRDAELKHPTPLHVAAASQSGAYRLYLGRDYVEFRRAK
ncbi:MAG TPA: hypothetical protein VJP87_06530 [Candidatus Acidoferrales bacterium]|nr:hypothetical protein [Candidatus Acidoferrales bacterium]